MIKISYDSFISNCLNIMYEAFGLCLFYKFLIFVLLSEVVWYTNIFLITVLIDIYYLATLKVATHVIPY